MLRYVKGYSPRRIALEMKISETAVFRLLYRARQRRIGTGTAAARIPHRRWVRPTSFTQCYDL